MAKAEAFLNALDYRVASLVLDGEGRAVAPTPLPDSLQLSVASPCRLLCSWRSTPPPARML